MGSLPALAVVGRAQWEAIPVDALVMQRALELDAADALAEVRESIEAGDWQRGAPLIDAALPLTTNPPGWVCVGYAFRYLETHDYEQALDWSLRSDAPNWFGTALTVTASAALAGRMDIAEREKKRLLALYPDFESTGRAQLAKWHMDPALLETLLDGLRIAGLRIA
jgi:adenylate cyclase